MGQWVDRQKRNVVKLSLSLVTIAKGPHPFPFRIRSLSLSAPMVLHWITVRESRSSPGTFLYQSAFVYSTSHPILCQNFIILFSPACCPFHYWVIINKSEFHEQRFFNFVLSQPFGRKDAQNKEHRFFWAGQKRQNNFNWSVTFKSRSHQSGRKHRGRKHDNGFWPGRSKKTA